ncbi:ComEA family DNA-binding protein [Pseudomonas panipatensis]|jgi:competence protein ComEA|uniref:Competence protein ComEA n=1 Tax=Pseudomonas panipatensis TaxID=428992 RepID=A0A1G8C7B4_9PSED|nr:helix-hairpin-helix domain-containing protein [Pseudomonas panipatensis]SDH41421.1 competence protein ComEA [Pseudomonas panipatensis]SMP66053.1 competence protein ComEA [Pseudomonas panipatensis]
MRKLSALLLVLLSSVFFSGLSMAAPQAEPAAPAAAVSQKAVGTEGAVNINTADASLLQQELKGIGKVKAEAIVAYREANGPFTTVDQLLEVKGIGKAILEKNRSRLSLE